MATGMQKKVEITNHFIMRIFNEVYVIHTFSLRAISNNAARGTHICETRL